MEAGNQNGNVTCVRWSKNSLLMEMAEPRLLVLSLRVELVPTVRPRLSGHKALWPGQDLYSSAVRREKKETTVVCAVKMLKAWHESRPKASGGCTPCAQ